MTIIKQNLKRLGIRNSDLARAMGVSSASIANLVNGNPTLTKLFRLAKAAGCRPSELIEEHKEYDAPERMDITIDGKTNTYILKKSIYDTVQ